MQRNCTSLRNGHTKGPLPPAAAMSLNEATHESINAMFPATVTCMTAVCMRAANVGESAPDLLEGKRREHEHDDGGKGEEQTCCAGLHAMHH